MRSFCLIFIFSLSCIFLCAKDKVSILPEPTWLYKVTPDFSKLPDARNIRNGYYYELLDYQTNISAQTDYVHTIKKIVNESGVQNSSEVSVSFSPEFEKVIFHKLTVIRDGKIVSELNEMQIRVVQEETETADYIYNGTKRAFVILKNIKKNDRIDFSYSKTGFNPVFASKYSSVLYFYNYSPVTNYFQTIIIPEGRKLNLTAHEGASMPAQSVSGKSRIYHWDNPSVDNAETPDYIPSWFDNTKRIDITEYNSWEEVIAWGNKTFNDYHYTLPPALKARILQWRRTANGDQDVFAGYARRFVQDEIRYLGLEIGQYTHVPHTPAEVFENGFGDCKDKSLLLATILRQENIPAYVALVNTRQRAWITGTAPSDKVFNHAIVAVERSNGYIFIDATISAQRGEMSNLYIAPYGYALVLKKGGSGFRKMEADDFNSSIITEDLDVPDGDSSHLTVTTQYCGGMADDQRNYRAETSAYDIEKSYVDYYAGTYEGIKISSPVTGSDDSSRNIYTVNERYAIPAIWKTDSSGKEYFSVYAKSVNSLIPLPPTADQKFPLALSYPYSTHYTLLVHMPGNWSFPVDEVHISTDYYRFDYTATVIGRDIKLVYSFKTLSDYVPAVAMEQYKKDYKRMSGTFEYALSRNLSKPGGVINLPANGINWVSVWFSFFLLAGLSFLFRHINRQEIEVEYDRHSGYRLGGWIIVLGMSILLFFVVNSINIVRGGYFSMAGWNALGRIGVSLQLVLLTELGCSILLTVECLALAYWYFKRRDIFRKYFLWYIGTMLFSNGVMYLLYSTVSYPSNFGNLQNTALTQLIRACIYSAIWGTYISRSQRVKGTFLRGA